MAQTPPPSITPSPATPDRADRATFSSRATSWSDWLKNNGVPEIAAVATNVYNNAVDAYGSTTEASNWAKKTDDFVSGSDNSAKSWAVGGTGNGAPVGGSAKDWATKATIVDTEYSAKAYASGTTPTGSAKDWATKTGSTVDGTGYSAKYHAEAAEIAAASAQSVSSFAGVWSTLTGALNKPATVFHAGKFWALTENIANVATEEPGVSAKWVTSAEAVVYSSYNSRNDLRGMTPLNNQLALIENLGLFRYVAGSPEIDDDETCFATASGRWLMEAAHPEAIDAWLMPDEDHEFRIGDIEISLTYQKSCWPGRILHGTAASSITSIAATSQASFTGGVAGAAVGDHVIANPPTALEPRVSVFARVTAANTVTVYLNNPSASSATLTAETWKISVIKES